MANAKSTGSPVVMGVAAACEIYARKLLGPAFKLKGYETLPVPQTTGSNSPKMWNFLVTAQHRQNEALDIVFSFVITDKQALQIIEKGFDYVFPVPKIATPVQTDMPKREEK